MTWIIASPSLLGTVSLLSDVRVTWSGGRYKDCLRKVYAVSPNIAVGFSGSVEGCFRMLSSFRNSVNEYNSKNAVPLSPLQAAHLWAPLAIDEYKKLNPLWQNQGCSLLIAGTAPGEVSKIDKDNIFYAHQDFGNLFFAAASPDSSQEIKEAWKQYISFVGGGSNITDIKNILRAKRKGILPDTFIRDSSIKTVRYTKTEIVKLRHSNLFQPELSSELSSDSIGSGNNHIEIRKIVAENAYPRPGYLNPNPPAGSNYIREYHENFSFLIKAVLSHLKMDDVSPFINCTIVGDALIEDNRYGGFFEWKDNKFVDCNEPEIASTYLDFKTIEKQLLDGDMPDAASATCQL